MKKGFSIVEVILVFAGLAFASLGAFSPSTQLPDTRNAQRRSDVATVLNAVYQYAIDNSGQLPPTIPESDICGAEQSHEICVEGGNSCSGVDLSVLTEDQYYLVELPVDPSVGDDTGTGYFINATTQGRVMVCAPSAEEDAVIEIVR